MPLDACRARTNEFGGGLILGQVRDVHLGGGAESVGGDGDALLRGPLLRGEAAVGLDRHSQRCRRRGRSRSSILDLWHPMSRVYGTTEDADDPLLFSGEVASP